MALDKDFLWGGALAAHQFEGGVLTLQRLERGGRHDSRSARCSPCHHGWCS
jgi:beta-glucosidase/6-phospho-beta-glucosidase/beta-galactosidase